MAFANAALHVAQPLVDFCVAYDPSSDNHIRNAFFKRKDTSHEVDLIHTVDTAETLRLYDLDVTGDSEVPEVEWKAGADQTIRVKPIAAKHRVTPALKAGADPAFNYELRATKQAMISVGQRMEYMAVNQTLRNIAIMTNYVACTSNTRFDAYGDPASQPLAFLKAGVNSIRVSTGVSNSGSSAREADAKGEIKIAMHEYTWQALTEHPGLLERLKYQGFGAILTTEILAKVLRMKEENILITSARYTSSRKGATAAYKSFIGSDIIIALCDDSDDLNSQALGREFVFDGLGDSNQQFLVRKWIEEGKGMHLHTPFVGVACAVHYLPTNVSAGFLITGAIDSTDTVNYPGSVLD